jgi:acyl carrier protein
MLLENIKEDIKEYIKNTIAKDENLELENDTLLISSRIIDSISTLKMVDYLEKKFKIEFQPHEVDTDNLDSIDLIAQFVASKIK